MCRSILFLGAVLSCLWSVTLADPLTDLGLPENATAQDLQYRGLLSKPMVVIGGWPSDAKTAEVLPVLEKYRSGGDPKVIEEFVEGHPNSPFRLWLEASLAHDYYRTGRYSDAMGLLEKTWERFRMTFAAKDRRCTYVVGVGVDLAGLYARLGRQDDLKSLLDDLKTYPVAGPASERLARSRESHSMMILKPERSFNCGPVALENVLRAEKAPAEAIRAIHAAEGGPTGFSLARLEGLAAEHELGYIAAKRGEEGELIFPCVVHWQADHYAAALREEGGRIRVVDPTFKKDFLMTKGDFLREASGNFLIKGDELPSGWEKLSTVEASQIFGKGVPGEKNDDDDKCPKDCGQNSGMPGYGYDDFLLAVTITDTPLFLETPYGPGMDFTLSYHQAAKFEQRAIGSGDPGDLGVPFTNVGTKWAHNWCSFVMADPLEVDKMRLFFPDGRRETHFDNGQGYDRHRLSQALLSATANGFKRTGTDGSEMVFEYAATYSGDIRYYLTKIIDAQDNELIINYELGPGSVGARITHIEDPFGRELVFEYDATNVFLVTKVTEEVNQVAKRNTILGYSASGELESVTDMGAISSSFSYDDPTRPDQVTSMTTPYGTTTFNKTSWEHTSGGKVLEYVTLSITDPENLTEHLLYAPDLHQSWDFGELLNNTPNIFIVPAETPTVELVEELRDSVLWEAVTLHWGKKVSKYHPPEFQTGKNFEFATSSVWMLSNDDGPFAAEPVLVTTRTPDTTRTFFGFPDWDQLFNLPSSLQPNLSARVVQNEAGVLQTEISRFTYTATGHPDTVTDPLGKITKYIYAVNGIDVEEVKVGVSPGTADKVVSKMVYGGAVDHLPTEIYDAANNKTTLEYNSKGQVTKVTNALSEIYEFTYMWPSGFIDPDAGENDGFLQSVKVTDSANNITAVEIVNLNYHADTGFVNEVTDPQTTIKTTNNTYDALGRVTKVTHADGSTEEFFFERDGVKILDLVKHLNREGLYSHYEYNGNRQLVKSTDPGQRVSRLKWCACGHLEVLIDALGRRTEWKRDLVGRITTKVLPDANEITYTYEAESGRLDTITYPNEQGTANASVDLAYYLDGSLAEKSYPGESDPFYASFTYDSLLGRLASAKWHDEAGVEQTSTYGYHTLATSLGSGATGTLGAGQLHTIDGPWLNDTVVYEYDELNRVIGTSIGDDLAPHGNASYTVDMTEIDGLGRISEIVNGLGTFTTVYSGNESRPDYMTGPGGANNFKVDYSYLTATNGGYLSQIKNTWAASTVSQFDYTYSEDGKIKTWKKLQGGTTADYMEFVYDFAGQLTKAVTKDTDSAGSVLKTLTYGYDRAGNRTAKIEDDEPYTASFNERNQLTTGNFNGKIPFIGHLNEFAEVSVTASGETRQAEVRESGNGFLFESEVQLSNGTVTQVDVDATDQNANTTSNSFLIDQGTGQWATVSYSANGTTSQRTVTEGTATTVDTFTWDRENRLKTITRGGLTQRFVYNAVGERVKHILEYSSTVEEDRFVWAHGLRPSQRREGTNSVERNYYAQGEEQIGASATAKYLYTRDHLGSVRELVESTTGVVAARYDYTPFGTRINVGTQTASTEISYTGHFRDPWFGYYLTRYRAYDSKLGRWLSPDPIGELGPDGANLYAYVSNNPTNLMDPTGMWGIQFGGTNFGIGHPTMIFNNESWGDLGDGAMATADGIVPGERFDPYKGKYDGCDKHLARSKSMGAASRNIALAAAGAGLWAKAGGATMSIGATNQTAQFHMFWGVSRGGATAWMDTALAGRTGASFLSRVNPYVPNILSKWNHLSGIPILFPQAAAAVGVSTVSQRAPCVTGALGALRRAILGF